MLELTDIYHSYDEKILLNGINLSLGENEVLCLLGPSGGGKSTILRIIAGFEMPKSGMVLYNGKNIIHEPVYKRNFGLVFQDYALFPHMTVYENIAFGLKMKGFPESDQKKKVNDMLAQLGLENFSRRKVTDLSGGEQQRVALARSIVVEPALLMLDEPLGALDYSLRQSLIDGLKNVLGRNGIPAIYVTHDQNEAFSLADRIAILHNGKIIQDAAPEELYAHPVNEWCAGFLGFHNIIQCEWDNSGNIRIDNFGKMISLPCEITPGSRSPKILLKNGKISGNDLTGKADFVLDAVPQKNAFRGDYYDVELKINDDTVIGIRNKGSLPLNQAVKLSYQRDDYIIYGNN